MPTRTPNQMFRMAARGAVILAAAALGTAAVAQSSAIDVSGHADSRSVTRSKIIAISDLNLADARGQLRLDQRLRHTASYVCNDSGMWGTRPPKDYTRCYNDALNGARNLVSERLAAGDSRPIRVASR